MNYTIRPVRPGDMDDVARLIGQVQRLHAGWRPDLYRDMDITLSPEAFADAVERGTMFAAERDGEVCGYMEVQFRHIENAVQVTRDILYIDTIAVDERHRGRGIGHLFFEEAQRIRDENGLDGIELQVNAANTAALEMYRSCGFTVKTYHMELLK
ncbi:MAG: GNAT family N-acetyltransferase [Oscillospiraceae bacterium]|nr:GNAT family N-acetyltransferase [Oscillospiraceae bacterium]